MMTTVEPSPPAGPGLSPGGPMSGWYADPWQEANVRWFDGQDWTAATGPGVPGPFDQRSAPLPFPVAVAAFVYLTVYVGVGLASPALLRLSHLPPMVFSALILACLWGGIAALAVGVSRRYGTGRVRDDLGPLPRWSDLGWGVLGLIGAFALQVIVSIIFMVLNAPRSTNTEIFRQVRDDRLAAIVLAAVAVIGAPLFEELFFRGLLQRGLRSRLSVVWAVVAQGTLFGAVHADVFYGWGNLSLVIALSLVGMLWGAMAHLFGRLGPTMAAHALLNGTVLLMLWTA